MDAKTPRKKYSRRDALKTGALSAAALCLGSAVTRRAYGATDSARGCLPTDILPAGIDGYKVLELHCFGGMAPYESFYYRDVAGSRTRGFDTQVENLNWNPMCLNPPSGLQTHDFSTDSNGKEIHLGPFSKRLAVSGPVI